MSLLTLSAKLHAPRKIDAQLVLPFELRQKSRLRARLSTGEEVGVLMERGTVLRGGDLLLASDGRAVEVVAAPETVSVVNASDPQQLARVAYHLGNRHVAVQIAADGLRYLHDHVLDDMVRGLGLAVTSATLPFDPEAGAYAGGHAHGPVHDLRLRPHRH